MLFLRAVNKTKMPSTQEVVLAERSTLKAELKEWKAGFTTWSGRTPSTADMPSAMLAKLRRYEELDHLARLSKENASSQAAQAATVAGSAPAPPTAVSTTPVTRPAVDVARLRAKMAAVRQKAGAGQIRGPKTCSVGGAQTLAGGAPQSKHGDRTTFMSTPKPYAPLAPLPPPPSQGSTATPSSGATTTTPMPSVSAPVSRLPAAASSASAWPYTPMEPPQGLRGETLDEVTAPPAPPPGQHAAALAEHPSVAALDSERQAAERPRPLPAPSVLTAVGGRSGGGRGRGRGSGRGGLCSAWATESARARLRALVQTQDGADGGMPGSGAAEGSDGNKAAAYRCCEALGCVCLEPGLVCGFAWRQNSSYEAKRDAAREENEAKLRELGLLPPLPAPATSTAGSAGAVSPAADSPASASVEGSADSAAHDACAWSGPEATFGQQDARDAREKAACPARARETATSAGRKTAVGAPANVTHGPRDQAGARGRAAGRSQARMQSARPTKMPRAAEAPAEAPPAGSRRQPRRAAATGVKSYVESAGRGDDAMGDDDDDDDDDEEEEMEEEESDSARDASEVDEEDDEDDDEEEEGPQDGSQAEVGVAAVETNDEDAACGGGDADTTAKPRRDLAGAGEAAPAGRGLAQAIGSTCPPVAKAPPLARLVEAAGGTQGGRGRGRGRGGGGGRAGVNDNFVRINLRAGSYAGRGGCRGKANTQSGAKRRRYERNMKMAKRRMGSAAETAGEVAPLSSLDLGGAHAMAAGVAVAGPSTSAAMEQTAGSGTDDRHARAVGSVGRSIPPAHPVPASVEAMPQPTRSAASSSAVAAAVSQGAWELLPERQRELVACGARLARDHSNADTASRSAAVAACGGAGGANDTAEELCKSTLHEVFGLSSFKPGQLDAITRVVHRQSSLVVLPTGGGKSLIYQLPAFLSTQITLVVSPLLALIHDQCAPPRTHRISLARTPVNAAHAAACAPARLADAPAVACASAARQPRAHNALPPFLSRTLTLLTSSSPPPSTLQARRAAADAARRRRHLRPARLPAGRRIRHHAPA